MKDTAHHLRNVQRKIIRASRQESFDAVPLNGKPSLVAMKSQSLVPSKRALTPKRAGQPKMMRTQTYH